MQFTLRDYSTSDFETLYEIDQACYQRGIAYSRRMLRWYLDLRESFCIVAESLAEPRPSPIGFIIAQAHRTEAYIITIDVLQAHRRSGVGKKPLRHLSTAHRTSRTFTPRSGMT